MILKLKEALILTQEEVKINDEYGYNIPKHAWNYIDGFSDIRTYSKLKSQIIDKDTGRVTTDYTDIYTLSDKGEDVMCIISGYDINGKFRKIATSLEAYIIDSSGKTIERLN